MITRKTKIINWMIFLLRALFALIYIVPVFLMVLGVFVDVNARICIQT